MGRIKVLPTRVANQIAAGEVVERPASVCKELLENSIDAGAAKLRIEVQSGGRRLIRVADDGCGMSTDDAMLAFERHATSKLREVGDLLAIPTLGFRGEALPSIGSVSRVLLETRLADRDLGSAVEVHGGRMRDVREEALAPGTTIAVRDLFYNVPARRKFLRAEKTELGHIVQLVTHYSLAHRGKAFLLSNEHATLLNATPVETLQERIYQIFGGDTLDRLVALDPVERTLEIAASPPPATRAAQAFREGRNAAEARLFRLHGFVSEPQVQKLNWNSVYIFVNKRLIRDKVILKAIASAYQNFMPPGCFPFALLFLDLAPEEVDVNVHPSKTEVRFRHQSFVHDFVRDAVRDRLEKTKPASKLPPLENPLENPAETAANGQPPSTAANGGGAAQDGSQVSEPASELPAAKSEPAPPARLGFDANAVIEIAAGGGRAEQSAQADAADAPAAAEPDSGAEYATHSRSPLAERSPESLVDLSNLRLLGQIQESFIVAAGADGLWLIDQHVAHERILFEKVLAGRLSGQVETQRLLMPIVLTLTPDQQVAFAEIEAELQANGFELEPFGRRTIAVKAAPAVLSTREIERLVHEILETPQREMRALSLGDLRRWMAATVACHAAIKINTPLEPEKMRWLLDTLAQTDCPMSCPHGRPIALKYGTRDILKAFHRI